MHLLLREATFFFLSRLPTRVRESFLFFLRLSVARPLGRRLRISLAYSLGSLLFDVIHDARDELLVLCHGGRLSCKKNFRSREPVGQLFEFCSMRFGSLFFIGVCCGAF